MLAGHKLALALGVVNGAELTDDELSRKQIVRAGEEMVKAGLAIVVNRPGTKQPMCTLTAAERKRADQQAKDEAAERGDLNFHRRTHKCGLAHAITDLKTATRVLTRLVKRGHINLGIEPRASRVLIVDVDTAAQAAEFALRCGSDRPALTVRSPGQKNKDGKWVHSNGGHIWFEVPEGVELPTDEGIYTDDAGWTAIWGEHQVLVPPSVRPEGAYQLVGSMHPLPDWLLETVTKASRERQERREAARRRRELVGPTAIDDWAAEVSWDDILIADGWTKTGLVKNCGCPQWTAPGEHASPESATAHEPGCAIYVCDRGHGPLHVWTDNPSEAVAAAIEAYGTRTLTKAQVITYTEGAGRMRQTLLERGVPDVDGPTVLRTTYTTWEQLNASPDGSASDNYDETVKENDDEDDDPEIPQRLEEGPDYYERMVRLEVERELRRREALQRIEAMDRPPLRLLSSTEFLNAPRPQHLVKRMLYRDSLARMFGAPGDGKSFLALDLALSVALGKFWDGVKLSGEPVIYVMAEGQAVNGDRTEAWLHKKGVDPSELEGKFFVVPDAVLLTETAAAPFIDEVRRIKPALVVLDTKNAMMVGEENSATDFAAMRRVLDQIRKASDCCVLLIDHTGYEGTRARGTSAGTAAMDTEIRVTKDDEESPSVITAEVTRDKAAEAGTKWAFRLLPGHPAPVLEPTTVPEDKADSSLPDWLTDTSALPEKILDYEGTGKAAIEVLARYMRLTASGSGDLAHHGRNLADARTDLKPYGYSRDTVGRAWSALKGLGFLESVFSEPTEVQERTGPHRWVVPS